MTATTPLVSVLMTAYNREVYIAEAIESVLNSSYTNFELLIVDDCSTDNTVAIAKGYEKKDERVKVFVNEKNIGDYPNRNKAASYAKGKYLKYLDSDDFLYPEGLQTMVKSMERFPEAALGLCSISDPERPYPVSLTPREAYLENFSGYGFFDRAPGASIILKSAFDKVGGFSGKRMIGDFELWLTLARYFPIVKFPRDLLWDRVHKDQERSSDYALNYSKLRKTMIMDAFSHPDCPLSPGENKLILRRLKKRKFVASVLHLIKRSWKKNQS